MLVALVAATVLTVPTAAHAKPSCSQSDPVGCLKRAATKHKVSFPLLRSIARCESGPALNPHAIAGDQFNREVRLSVWVTNTAAGLVQFKPSTFATTPYARHGHRAIFSARWNAMAGAWLLRRAGTSPWVASRHCWG